MVRTVLGGHRDHRDHGIALTQDSFRGLEPWHRAVVTRRDNNSNGGQHHEQSCVTQSAGEQLIGSVRNLRNAKGTDIMKSTFTRCCASRGLNPDSCWLQRSSTLAVPA